MYTYCKPRINIVASLFLCMLFSCKEETSFRQIPSSHSGIHFNNNIIETDSINVLDFENVYNGGGVGFGDFNNDGLQDVYFSGNMVSNKLYLNKGNFKFEDITEKAGVEGKGRWCRGVSVVDLNNDSLQDIYVCASINRDSTLRQNLLYINQGNDKDGTPVFKELATEYGLNAMAHSTMAAFFDYDNDNDLDVYILVNEIVKGDYPNKFKPIVTDGSHPNTGRLYRNDWNDSLNHPVFTNVSKAAGVTIEGYGHGVNITDINRDGWKDIYVSNDYLSNNILYINNGNGTFTDRNAEYFKHASANAMGNDVTDINNDGLVDVIELDMNPEDNFRKKMMLNQNSYQTYQNSDHFGYHYQYVRNTLQLNRGPRVNQNDSIGDPIFSDIAFFSGVAETDWSWTPLVIDFDNDGFRDLIITNGFPKDVTDHDFIAFRKEAYLVASKQQMLEQIPAVKIPNYAYRNNGDLTFTNVTKEWGINKSSFSNGAAYADLDNDGDMDYVVNNINDRAFVYENLINNKKHHGLHYLQIKFTGQSPNIGGLGAWVELYYGDKQQVFEYTPYRGYLSSVQNIAHFGLGPVATIDSVLIKWPGGKMQLLQNVKADQLLSVNQKDAGISYSNSKNLFATNTLIKEISDSIGLNIMNKEDDFIDFNVQKLLPHKLSDYGPALAVGDINGDSFEDLVIGGSNGYSTQLAFQQSSGKFLVKDLVPDLNRDKKPWKDMGVLLFDADKDNDLDLYISSGGNEYPVNTISYQDKLYVNDGKGNFLLDSLALPSNLTSKSCVRGADYDRDGDLDLFIAGRLLPWQYPAPVSSFIYRNDSKDGKIKFTDVTASIAKDLLNIGLTCDMLWTDFNNDGWIDIMLAGEFMPVIFLKNEKGVFTNNTANSGIAKQVGWWNSIVPGDFDNDGDMDYIVGNAGRNSFYRPSENFPVRMYGKDFDNNGNYDAIPSVYLPDINGTKKEFPAQVRDDLIKQMIEMRDKFKTYNDFATATFDKFLTKDQLKGAIILSANNFNSVFLRNDGKGSFVLSTLPAEAQLSSIFGMLAEDLDGDGNLDVVLNGNDYGTEVSVGRYDALNGLVLMGDGKGNFSPQSILQSGFFIPANGKSVVKICNTKRQCLVIAAQNRGMLKSYLLRTATDVIPISQEAEYAVLKLSNGTTRKHEFNYGSSFLSQPGRFLNDGKHILSIEVYNNKGIKKVLK